MSKTGHNSNENHLAGKRAILMPRASTTKQQSSIKDQLKDMRAFAERNGLIVVGEIGNAGISASKPWEREDFEEIINRKESVDDFDVLVVYDASRFTRSGTVTGAHEIHALRSAGIEVVFSSQQIAEGPLGEMQLMQSFAVGQGEVIDRARAVCRGRQSAIEDGRCIPCRKNPFGTDRLVSFSDGRPRHIVHHTRLGGQEIFDGITLELIETHPPKGDGARSRYMKQKFDHEELVPGAQSDIDTVLWIFAQKFVHGVASNRIAATLNRNGVSGITGGKWSNGSVDSILRQTAYSGFIVANQMTQANYYRCSSDGPMSVEKNIKARAGVEAPGVTIRPQEDWTIIDQPQMKDFLPQAIREEAKKYALERLARRSRNAGKHKRKREKYNRDSHKDSDFFLSGLLVESRTEKHMVGCSTKKYRYYRIKGVNNYPGEERIKPDRIRAEQIEDVTMRAIEQVISETDDLFEIVRSEAQRQRRTASLSEREFDRLVAEQKKLDDDCAHIHQNRSVYGEEMTLRLVAENRQKYQDIDERLEAVDRLDDIWGKDMDKKVRDLVKELKVASKWLRRGPRDAARRLVRLMVEKAHVNAETKEIKLALRVPKSFYDDPKSIGLLSKSLCQDGQQTKNDKSLHIKTLHFQCINYRKGEYAQIEVPNAENGRDEPVQVGGRPVGEERRLVQLLLWPVAP